MVAKNKGSLDISKDLTVGSTLVAAGLTYPTSDGSNNQVIETNGAGTLTFVNQSGGAGGGDIVVNQAFSI